MNRYTATTILVFLFSAAAYSVAEEIKPADKLDRQAKFSSLELISQTFPEFGLERKDIEDLSGPYVVQPPPPTAQQIKDRDNGIYRDTESLWLKIKQDVEEKITKGTGKRLFHSYYFQYLLADSPVVALRYIGCKLSKDEEKQLHDTVLGMDAELAKQRDRDHRYLLQQVLRVVMSDADLEKQIGAEFDFQSGSLTDILFMEYDRVDTTAAKVLGSPAVQKHLEMTVAQIRPLNEFAKKWRKKRSSQASGDPEDLAKLRDECIDEIKGLLMEDQFSRLQQILRQRYLMTEDATDILFAFENVADPDDHKKELRDAGSNFFRCLAAVEQLRRYQAYLPLVQDHIDKRELVALTRKRLLPGDDEGVKPKLTVHLRRELLDDYSNRVKNPRRSSR